jgi:hypothetical protein
MMLLAFTLLAQLASSHATTTQAAAPEATMTAGGLSWSVPKGWTSAPASSMRVATYRTPAAPGDPEGGEVAVFYFGPGQGGSVDANVDRWFAQITGEPGSKKPTRSQIKVGAIPVTLCAAEGIYNSGMAAPAGGSSGPRKGFALEGAIAEGPQGAVFFKLTGPKKTVAKAKAGFDVLVKSLKSTS